MYDLFNKIINLQFNNLNKIDYEKEIRLLKDKQKLILDIIYENDGVDSKYIEKQLNISPQYLYNLTNDKKILKLIIINKNKWSWRGLNPRPSDYESAALTD